MFFLYYARGGSFHSSAIVSYSDQVAWDRKAMEKCDTHQPIENDDRYYYPERNKNKNKRCDFFRFPFFILNFIHPV